MVKKGEGIAKNEKRAVELYTKACTMGHPMGRGTLGRMYLMAEGGLKRSISKADHYLQKACTKKHRSGCKLLGTMHKAAGNIYAEKKANPVNRKKAVYHFEKGCAAGNKAACDGLKALR